MKNGLSDSNLRVLDALLTYLISCSIADDDDKNNIIELVNCWVDHAYDEGKLAQLNEQLIERYTPPDGSG